MYKRAAGFGQFTRIGHITGRRRPLLREGVPISYEARTSPSFHAWKQQPNDRAGHAVCSPIVRNGLSFRFKFSIQEQLLEYFTEL